MKREGKSFLTYGLLVVVLGVWGGISYDYIRLAEGKEFLRKEVPKITAKYKKLQYEVDLLKIEKEKLESRSYIFAKIREYRISLVTPSPINICHLGAKKKVGDRDIQMYVKRMSSVKADEVALLER
jgi:hypothetical protein